MLGTILGALTDPARAEELLAAIGDAAMLARVREAAAASGIAPGAYAAATVRHLIEHGSEEIWLGLVGRMANSPQPGAAALEAMLAHAFPAPRGTA